MSLINYLKKPEYFFQPSSIVKRLFTRHNAIEKQKTAWGSEIEINPKETIGRAISMTGIYDLAVSEILWLLIKPGDFVVDIGANIGYTTILSSYKTGIAGKVWAFEPNPLLLSRLKKNLQSSKYQNSTLFPVALSSCNGEGILVLPGLDSANDGLAYIGSSNSDNTVNVELKTLDDLLPQSTIVNVLKIDVEGHELSVFKGAEKALDNKIINNILFEDQNEYPSEVSRYLLEKGYKIFRIEKGWFKVHLKNPHSLTKTSSWEPANYLATLDVEYVKEKISGYFYKCLFN